MRFQSVLDRFDSDLWGHHIMVPEEVATHFTSSTGTRVVCTLDEVHTFHCALMSLKGGRHFININKAARDKLGLVVGQGVQVSLRPDTTPYGMPMSEEFAEVLRQDEVAAAYFHALTPGKQRTLIYFADNVKSGHIKLRRAFVIMDHLVMHGGSVDFKVLNTEMKAANQNAKKG